MSLMVEGQKADPRGRDEETLLLVLGLVAVLLCSVVVCVKSSKCKGTGMELALGECR